MTGHSLKTNSPGHRQEETGTHFLDYWRVVRARKEIIFSVLFLVSAIGIFVSFVLLPKVYEARCIIEVKNDDPSVQFGSAPTGDRMSPYFLLTEYERIQTRPIMEEVVRREKLEQLWGEKWNNGNPLPLDLAVKYLKSPKFLTVSQHRSTTFISIAFRSEDPKTCQNVANRIAEVYQEFRVRQAAEDSMMGINVLKEEMEKQKVKVDAAEDKVARIQKDLDIAIVNHGTIEKNMMARMLTDRVTYQLDVEARKHRLDKINELTEETIITSLPLLVADPVIESLRKQWIDSKVALELLKENYGENHPEVRRLNTGVREIKSSLDAAIIGVKTGLQTDYEVAKAKLDTLVHELDKLKDAEIKSTGERIRPYERALRDQQMEQGFYEALLARLKTEGIDRELPREPVNIVEKATEPSLGQPIKPNLILNTIMSVVVGLGLGIGLAYFIEYLDTSVKTVEDVEQFLGTSVVGVIPQRTGLLTKEGPDSPHAEAYRVLRTNLHLSSEGMDGGAFAVSSGGVGEGKSTTLFNLAFICASMGRKVLVVDSDMRRPVQHKNFEVGNEFGLTNVLMRDVPAAEAIKQTETPNLFFMPSGRLPRGAVGLLDNRRVRDLVTELKEEFDYIFFDSPPVMGVSDASILASEMDGVLLVVQYRKYPRSMSLRAKQVLENIGARVIGVVLNNINVVRDDNYFYYSSYYSHYANTENTLSEGQSLRGKAAPAPSDQVTQTEERF